MTQYAIARVAKIKTMQNLSKLGSHHVRTRETPNADPSRKIQILAGSGDPAADVKALLPEKIRSNAVLAMEHLLTASPEYFRPDNPREAGTYDEKRMKIWCDKAMEYLQERYGDNLASAVLHLDEATPHIQALVVPRRPDGKLDAAKLFGPDQLRNLQDTYAAKMAPLGLQRGIEGSEAEHESIKQYYGRVKEKPAPLPEIVPKPKDLPERTLAESTPFTSAKAERDQLEADYDKQLDAHQKSREKHLLAAYKQSGAVIAKANEYERQAKANKARDAAVVRQRAEIDELKAKASVVREIPLESVLEGLGCERDPADKKNWKTPIGRITVTGSKFFNHDLQEGGGGAIDLVKQQLGCDYKGAVAYLAKDFGNAAAVGQALSDAKEKAEAMVKEAAPSKAPAPSKEPKHVERVRSYLVEQRKLDAGIVDKLMDQGVVYAAAYSPKPGSVFVNAAFRLKGGGVELRGTVGNYHGVRGQKDVFQVQRGAEPQKAAFVESAIDAISYLQLHQGESVKVISTTGSSAEKLAESVKMEAAAGRSIVAAFDTDSTGRQLSEIVKFNAGKQFEKRELPPHNCKDWNEVVQLQADPARLATVQKQAELKKGHGMER